MYTVQGSLFPEMFPTNVRFTGASLGQQLAGPLGGGLAPIISVYLYSQFNSYWALSGYLIGGRTALSHFSRFTETSSIF